MDPPNSPITSRTAFASALQALNTAGWTYRELMTKCRANGAALDHRTIGTWFTGSSLPSPKLWDDFRVLLSVLGATQAATDQWLADVRRLRRIRGISAVVPYPGLDSYGMDDAPYFFGRETHIQAVLTELESLLDGGALLIVGSSGAGKTSLLQAGVRPALARGALDSSAEWTVISLQAGTDPLTRLAAALEQQWNEPLDPRTLPQVVTEHVRRHLPAGRILLIVDQLEQAFLAASETGDGELTGFLTALRTMTCGVGALVLLGLRADQYGAAQDNLLFQDLTGGRQVAVTPMSEADLRAVITEPALKNGVVPEPGFVELVAHEVSSRTGTQAAVLPQLSQALRKTWLAGQGKRMTATDYRQAGGIDRAVSDTAEAVFAKLAPTQRTLARTLFFQLVLIHPAAADTRRQAALSDLVDDGRDSELYEVLYRFASPGLLTVDAGTVEITHESLIVSWHRLRSWLDDDRSGRLLAQQLTLDATEWARHGRDQDHLYQGTRLSGALEWQTRHRDELPPPVNAFLTAGVRRSRRRTRRLRQAIALLSVLLLTVCGLAATVIVQERTATRERDEAVSRMIASEVSTLRDVDISLARQLALVAFRVAPTVEARSALLDATGLRWALRTRPADKATTMYALAHHPTDPIVALGLGDTVRLWTSPAHGTPAPIADLPADGCVQVHSLAFHPRGDLLAAGCRDGRLHLWQGSTPLTALTGLGGTTYSLAFTLDGSLLAAGIGVPDKSGHRGMVKFWRVDGTTLTPVGDPIDVGAAYVTSLSLHSRTKQLALGTDSGAVEVWDITDVTRPARSTALTGPTKAIGQLAYSPDGAHLAAGGADGQTYLWNTSGTTPGSRSGTPLSTVTAYTNALAFSPDNTTLAVASSNGTLGTRIFDVATHSLVATLPHPSPVTSVTFTPDGQNVLTGANDGIARLWPVRAQALPPVENVVSSTRFSPDGTLLAVGSADLRLYDVTNPRRPLSLGPGHTNPDNFTGALAFAPDGTVLAATRGNSGTVQLYSMSTPRRPEPLGSQLAAHRGQVEHLSFSPDGTVLSTGGRDGAVHLWDVHRPDSPAKISTPATFAGPVHWTTFNHDGTVLVAGSADHTIRIWNTSDPARPTPLGPTLTPADHYVYSTVFSPDGRTLAVSLGDSSVHLYDMTDPAHPAPLGPPLAGPNDYAYSVAFDDAGTTLAGAFNDGTVWIWDLTDRTAPHHHATLSLPVADVYTVAFQPRHGVFPLLWTRV